MSAARLEELSELTWEKETLVAGPLHEGVGGVTVGLHPGEPHLPALVLLLPDVAHDLKRACNLQLCYRRSLSFKVL